MTDNTSPLPWELEVHKGRKYFQINSEHHAVCTNSFCYADEWEANAKLIVEAVNNHDKLKAENEALKSALLAINQALDEDCSRPPGMGSNTLRAIARISNITRQALSNKKE